MDAADLARWTRFAAKGGIGRCTAVQDCIAESPEDLMFLKDDEITVLMQLPGAVGGRYLGYCEGVVGRFLGAHVHFHGKLKRPVMTKRQSSNLSGGGVHTSSPSSAAPSPSPRISSATLPPGQSLSQTANGASASNSAAGSAIVGTGIATTDSPRLTGGRTSSVLSDPFDLELEPAAQKRKGRRSASLARERRDRETASPQEMQPQDRAALDGDDAKKDFSFAAEADTRVNSTAESFISSTPASRRSEESLYSDTSTPWQGRRSRVRAGDELPGLEMFLPRSRSGSRSGASVSRPGSAHPADASVPLQPATRADSFDRPPPSPLRMKTPSTPPWTAASVARSSPSTYSQSQGSHHSGSPHTRVSPPLPPSVVARIGSPLTLPSSSTTPAFIVHAGVPSDYPFLPASSSPAPGSQPKEEPSPASSPLPVPVAAPTPSPEAPFQNFVSPSPQAAGPSHSPGGVVQIKVDVDVVVDYSEPEEPRWEVGRNPPMFAPASLPGSKVRLYDEEEDLPPLRNGFGSPEGSASAPHLPRSHPPASEPVPVPANAVEAEARVEESSLYDHASARSSIYSARSLTLGVGSSSGPAAKRQSFGGLSHASSDDGALGFGIGMSMLQDMADDDEDEEGVEVEVGEKDEDEVPETPQLPEVPPTGSDAEASTELERAPKEHDTPQRGQRISEVEGSNTPPHDDDNSDPEYEYGSDEDGSEYWDGADIYDSYRYSRYSVMTRQSRRKSGHSFASKYSVADYYPPPPVPSDQGPGSARATPPASPSPLATSHPINASTEVDELSPLSVSSPVIASPLSNGAGTPTEERRRHVPPPLNLAKPVDLAFSRGAGALLSPNMGGFGASDESMSRSPSRSRPVTSEFGASPLLHTNFPSPGTASSRVTSFGGDESGYGSASASAAGHRSSSAGLASAGPIGLALTVGASPLSPNSGMVVSPLSPVGLGGAASALRQRLENERSPLSPALVSAPAPLPGARNSEEDKKRTSGAGIVVDDDEDINVVVVAADADRPPLSAGTFASVYTDAKEEPEPEPESKPEAPASLLSREMRDSLQSGESQASVASSAVSSVGSEVSREMRRMEADLASAGPLSPTGSSLFGALSEQRTPTSEGSGTTQPLRIQRTGAAQERFEAPTVTTPTAQQQEWQHSNSQPTIQQPKLESPPLQAQSQPIPRPRPAGQDALFLPHPNAPRPNPAVLSGQRQSTYGMPPIRAPQPVAAIPASDLQPNSLVVTLRAAAASAPIARPTIYGRPVIDLSSADGPVPMAWALHPFPAEPVGRTGTPVGAGAGARAPRRSATTAAAPAPSPLSQSISATGSPSSPRSQTQSSAIPNTIGARSSTASTSTSASGPGAVLMRPNFSPQVRTTRPRSRSFSGFSSELPTQPVLKDRSSEEGSRPSRAASLLSLRDAALATARGIVGGGGNASQRSSSGSISSVASARGVAGPSPLSRAGNNTILGPPQSPASPKASNSPLRHAPIFEEHVPPQAAQAHATPRPNGARSPPPQTVRASGLRQVVSVSALRSDGPGSPLVMPPTSVLQPVRRNSGPSEVNPAVASSSTASAPTAIERLRRISSGSKKHQRTVSQQSRTSSNSDAHSTHASPQLAIEKQQTQSTSVQRTSSLKSKLSLPHLRLRNVASKDALPETQSPSPSTAPATPVFDFDGHPETVQVQDAEFELVRPTMRRISSEPTSDDSMFGRDESSTQAQHDARPESPGGGSTRSVRSMLPGARGEPSFDGRRGSLKSSVGDASAAESTASVEAHRARELRWIAAMSAVPAAQARKSKKVRRLVLEGVPASVRYLVWAHLTDSKARKTPGVYGVLNRREKVRAADAIERDAVRCFPDQPHLGDSKGPLVSLLVTYLTMVPDVEYNSNLALIAGYLLLQSPEEDAFWTFVSIMDLHLRAYFSHKSVQLEADALVFGKIVEALQPQVAKRVFVDMGIPPVEICRLWFSSLFATALPQEYVNRIWDVYLCEGPAFLFRVGLSLLSSSKPFLEAALDRTALFATLSRLPAAALPSEPDSLVADALGLKLRDDDVRKQRMKIEATLKRQTQTAPRPAGAVSAPKLLGSISMPRSGT